jgi:hypothetical protein
MKIASIIAVALLTASAGIGVEIEAGAFVSAELQSRKPKQFSGDLAARARKAGDLSGGKAGLYGVYRYEATIPETGFYVFSCAPSIGGYEFFVGEDRVYPTRKTHPEIKTRNTQKRPLPVGSFYLEQGKVPFSISRTRWPQSFAAISGFSFRKAVTPEESIQVKIANPFENEVVIRKDGLVKLDIAYANFPTDATLSAVISEAGGKPLESIPFSLRASKGLRKVSVSFPAAAEGIFQVGFKLGNQPLSGAQAKNFELTVIDASPVAASSAEAPKTLIAEIDCVKRAPDFQRGETRLVEKPFGAYLETEDNFGFSRDETVAKNNSFAAWKLMLPEAEVPYLFEFDYPDDTERSTMFVLRESFCVKYPKSISADCGGEFKRSNQMRTASLIAWPLERDVRLMVIPGAEKMRGAIAKIRVYRIDAGRLSPLVRAEKGKRGFLNFYEEEGSLIGHYAGVRYDGSSTPQRLKALERYCQLASYFGFDTLLYGIIVYGADLYPTWKIHTSCFGNPYSNDFARMMLLVAEKYGLDVRFEFSYNRKPALGKYFMTDNCLLNNLGKPDYWTFHNFQVNPIHPATKAWREGAIREFAERYADAKNFSGMHLRNMTWQNNGVNNFSDIRYGYDDYTVNHFTADTGIKVPTRYHDVRRFQERHQLLTGKLYEQWVDWRIKRVTQVYVEGDQLLKSIRPDLSLTTNVYKQDLAETREAGVDPDALDKAGISTRRSCTLGRHKRVAENRAGFLAAFDPRPASTLAERSMFFGLPYLEGGQLIAKPNELGYHVKANKIWYGSASWAAGENLTNPWAFGLARLDLNKYSTGGIAYCFSDRPLREFMKFYRRLPAEPFETLALDPVAVRRRGEYCYAVNTLPVPVTVEIPGLQAKLLTDGSAFSLRSFELRPYQLLAFRVSGKAGKIVAKVPESYRQTVANQVNLLAKHSKTKQELFPVNMMVQNAWKQQEYWKVNNLLDRNAPLMRENGLVIPSMHDCGELRIPENAIVPEHADTLLHGWTESKFAVAPSVLLKTEIAADGQYRLCAGIAGGDEFAPVAVYANGKKIGEFDNVGGETYASELRLFGEFPIQAGEANLEFRSADGKKPVGVLYGVLTSKLQQLPPYLFLVSKSYTAPEGTKGEVFMAKVEAEETERDFSQWKSGHGTKNDSWFVASRGGDKFGNYGYALFHIKSPIARTVEIGFGADYLFKISLNGQEVCGMTSPNGKPFKNQFRYLLKLNAGWNEVLFKIGSGSDSNGFWCSINDPGDLRFSPDKGSERSITPFACSTMLDVDFSKMSTEELKTLAKKSRRVNNRQFLAWFQYHSTHAPAPVQAAYADAIEKFTKAAHLRLELLKKAPASAAAATAYEKAFGEPKWQLGSYGHGIRFGPEYPKLSKEQLQIVHAYQAAQKTANLARNPDYAAADSAAEVALRQARKLFDQYWRADLEASNFRKEICRFHELGNDLRAEIKRRGK